MVPALKPYKALHQSANFTAAVIVALELRREYLLQQECCCDQKLWQVQSFTRSNTEKWPDGVEARHMAKIVNACVLWELMSNKPGLVAHRAVNAVLVHLFVVHCFAIWRQLSNSHSSSIAFSHLTLSLHDFALLLYWCIRLLLCLVSFHIKISIQQTPDFSASNISHKIRKIYNSENCLKYFKLLYQSKKHEQ